MIDYNNIQKALCEKDSFKRLSRFTEILNDALFSPEPIFKTDSLSDDCKEFWYLMRHAEFLWDDAVHLLRRDSYPSAIFFSIVTLEELGKLSVARFQIAMNEAKRSSPACAAVQPRKTPLYSHHKKHQLAAFSGFAVNSRADRILGLENIEALLDLAETGKLENIRQNCIYSKPEQGMVTLLRTSKNRGDAVFFCMVAGELLAEIGGFSPEEFERLIGRVQKFEEEFPLPAYKLEMTA